jgi:FkbM family methyltransferase
VGLREYVNKPYYVFRPDQIVRRVARRGDVDEVRLPWGLPLRFDPAEAHGQALLRMGLNDIATTETLFRLTPPGGRALDVGANIGHMTSVLAYRAGPGGSVTAFEPHPDTFRQLAGNVALWDPRVAARVELRQEAASSERGEARLGLPEDHARNTGRASLEGGAEQGPTVSKVTLDDVIEGPVDVMKIDVEGHELAVLEGAERLLRAGAIRNVVFEEHRPPPTPVTELLADRGFTVLRIEQTLAGPRLERSLDAADVRSWDPPNFLATLAPEATAKAFAGRGWRCLRPRSTA